MLGFTLAFALPIHSACADDPPARKPGLWEITSGGEQPEKQVMRLCLDTATEVALLKKAQATMRETCSRHDSQMRGNVLTDESVCQLMSSEIRSHTVTTYDGDAAYRVILNSHFNPPLMGKTQSSTTQDAKWLGPCGTDMNPGDMIVNGKKIRTGPVR